MKKKILSLMIALSMVLCITGCDHLEDKSEDMGNNSPFFTIYKGVDVYIYVDKETNVQYVMVNNGRGGVGFQPLYNADGTLKLYQGE